jgi:UDP-GlcNAc3NAcA epimerase
MPKLLTILGARPQFIKAAALTRAIKKLSHLNWSQDILHTGQHYDAALSDVFFKDLKLPQPVFKLSLINTERPQRMFEMKAGITSIVTACRPDAILVYGDTDSTLAGAQVASTLNIPLIHIEAGLRSFDLSMPEEVNRIETDNLSTILVAPTPAAILNLESEGIYGAFLTGDVMHDNALHFTKDLDVDATNTVLLTLHRPSNVDDVLRLKSWVEVIGKWCGENKLKAIFPVHPRTFKSFVEAYGEAWADYLGGMNIKAIEPVGYVELLTLIKSSKLVITDSGGVQKEAYSCGKPSVVTRHNTEWVELLEAGHTVLSPEPADLASAASSQLKRLVDVSDNLYGDGKAAESILAMMSDRLVR